MGKINILISKFLNILRSSRGFTLAELLVVVSIIAMLITAGTVTFNQGLKRARDSKRIADMQEIRTALELFYQDHGRYPGECEGISNSGEKIGEGNQIDTVLNQYMDRIPRDPLHDGSRYYYAYDPRHNRSVSANCSTQSGHPLYRPSSECNCTNDEQDIALVGFRRSETNNASNLQMATCSGGDEELNVAHYSIGMKPIAPFDTPSSNCTPAFNP